MPLSLATFGSSYRIKLWMHHGARTTTIEATAIALERSAGRQRGAQIKSTTGIENSAISPFARNRAANPNATPAPMNSFHGSFSIRLQARPWRALPCR